MSSIDIKTIATRLRVAKNFGMLVDSGIDSETATAIVCQYRDYTFNEVRVADDRVVICYKTCASNHSVNFPIAA